MEPQQQLRKRKKLRQRHEIPYHARSTSPALTDSRADVNQLVQAKYGRYPAKTVKKERQTINQLSVHEL
jgi:hypothetical protein